jgi:hypothetical protein
MGIFELPEGYHEIKSVDFLNDKKLAIVVNLCALLLAICLFILGNFRVSFQIIIGSDNLIASILGALGLIIGVVLYLVLHELTHGFFIKKYSGRKARYGFTGMYAYAASDAFFTKHQYIIIALAPVVIFGCFFLLLNILLPGNFFWLIYFMQIMNISGATGDFYITYLMSRLPADVLTTDVGVVMKMYSRDIGRKA